MRLSLTQFALLRLTLIPVEVDVVLHGEEGVDDFVADVAFLVGVHFRVGSLGAHGLRVHEGLLGHRTVQVVLAVPALGDVRVDGGRDVTVSLTEHVFALQARDEPDVARHLALVVIVLVILLFQQFGDKAGVPGDDVLGAVVIFLHCITYYLL